MTPLDSRAGPAGRIRRCRLDSRTVVLGVAGAVAGVLCGLLGVAGGVVIVPVLTSRRIGMARAAASGTTIAAVLPISVVAAVTYAALHNIDEPTAIAIIPGAAAGVIIGSLLATRVRASALRSLFQLVLLATAARLLVALPSGSIRQIAVEVPAVLTLCALGTVAGLASGMLGSGGGSFLVPALVLGFGFVQQVAQGTALLALIPIWVIGALTHRKTHTLGLREAAAVGLCGALTVPLGAGIASHVGALPLRVIFAAFLVATVGRGLVHTRNRGNQPPPAAQQREGSPELGRRRTSHIPHAAIAARAATRDPGESPYLSMPRPHSLQPGGPQANELGTPARPDSEVDLLAELPPGMSLFGLAGTVSGWPTFRPPSTRSPRTCSAALSPIGEVNRAGSIKQSGSGSYQRPPRGSRRRAWPARPRRDDRPSWPR